MTKRIYKTCWTVLLLALLLGMLAPQALADSAPAGAADAVYIAADGTVTLTSTHMAEEKVSSIQLKLEVGTASAGFDFQVGEMTKASCSEDGILSVYIAGADPLMGTGTTKLTLGKVTGVDGSSVKLVPNSLEYVYVTRLIAQAVSAGEGESSGGPSKSGLQNLLESAKARSGENGENAGKYTKETWGALQQAISDAEKAYGNAEATAEELNAAYDALQTALDGLVYQGQAELEAAVAKAKDKLSSGSYEQKGVDALNKAIKDAEDAIASGDENTNWEGLTAAVNDAADALQSAYDPGPGGGDPEDPEGGDDGDDEEPSPTPKPTDNSGSQQKAPDTGDETAVLPWMAMLCLSGALLAVTLRRRGKCRQ